jgi:hypothetical protein
MCVVLVTEADIMTVMEALGANLVMVLDYWWRSNMRKIKKRFCSTGYVGSERSEIKEVEDNATEEELQEEFQKLVKQ